MKTQHAMIPNPDLNPSDTFDEIAARLAQARDVVTIMSNDEFDRWSSHVKAGVAWSVQHALEDMDALIEHLWQKVRPLVNASENDFSGHEMPLTEHMERLTYISEAVTEWVNQAGRYPEIDDVEQIIGKVLPAMIKARQHGGPPHTGAAAQ